MTVKLGGSREAVMKKNTNGSEKPTPESTTNDVSTADKINLWNRTKTIVIDGNDGLTPEMLRRRK
jgi:hypothetical protein